MTVKALRTHASDFDPWFPTSIAYRPLPRAALDTFLVQRGVLRVSSGSLFTRSGVLTSGLINRLYFRLNEIVFEGHPSKVKTLLSLFPYLTNLLVKILHSLSRASGAGWELVPIASIADDNNHQRSSSLGTGGGTDHDDTSIRERPFYKYEEAYGDHRGKWRGKFAVWFGLTPFTPIIENHTHDTHFDVRLDSEHHQYIHL